MKRADLVEMEGAEEAEEAEALVAKLQQEVELLRQIIRNQSERERRNLDRSERVAVAAWNVINRLFTAHWRMEKEHIDALMAFGRDREKLKQLLELQGFCFECATHYCQCGSDDD